MKYFFAMSIRNFPRNPKIILRKPSEHSKNTKNQNHHVKDEFVYNFKVENSHAGIFLASGIYQVEWQKIFFDKIGFSTSYKSDNLFNYRWIDVILRKSYSGFFSESKQLKS